MSIHLYDSAWVRFRDSDEHRQVFKNPNNPVMFKIAEYQSDIDGRAFHFAAVVPDIVEILSIRQAQGPSLSTQYKAPKDIHI